MDIQKTIIYIGLFFVGLMLWAEWQKEQADIQVQPEAKKTAIEFNQPKQEASTTSSSRAPTHLNQSTNQNAKALQSSHVASKNTISIVSDTGSRLKRHFSNVTQKGPFGGRGVRFLNISINFCS